MNTFFQSCLLAGLVLVAGCSSMVVSGGGKKNHRSAARVYLAPYVNATDDDHAARALTELTGSALLDRGIAFIAGEAPAATNRLDNTAVPDRFYLEAARSRRATHLLVGTVHEYHYKTDLNGDPVVGITLRLLDPRDGRTLWQGSSAHTSIFFGSLTSAAEHAVHRLIDQMPLDNTPPETGKPSTP